MSEFFDTLPEAVVPSGTLEGERLPIPEHGYRSCAGNITR
jgi:hypothetical protein